MEPTEFDSYLKEFEDGKPIPLHAGSRIFSALEGQARRENNLDMAQIAIRAAHLEARAGNGEHRENALRQAMAFRAGFISRMGSRPDHPVLDKDIIVNWFFQELEFSIDVAKEIIVRRDAEGLAGLTSNEMLEARRIKNRLNVLKQLADCNEMPNDSTLTEWLKIRNHLP